MTALSHQQRRQLTSSSLDGADLLPRIADCRPIRTAAAISAAGFTIRVERRVLLVVLPADVVLAAKEERVH